MTGWMTNPLSWLVAASTLIGVGVWIGKVNEHRSTVHAFMVEIREDIKRILGRLPSATVVGQSPLKLTELGQSISETLNASQWAEESARMLAVRTKGKSPFDIQDFCMRYVHYEFHPPSDLGAKIKMCAYENGIDSKQVFDVLAIELRDKLLSFTA